MFSHDEIWIAIDKLAQKAGYSTSGLAKKAGLDATAFNRSKRMSPEGKPRWPSTESLSKILAVTNITMNEFIAYIQVENSNISKPIPVIGYAQAGENGYFTDAGYPLGEGWDYVDLPYFAPKDDTTYALQVTGNSMMPLYREGDIIVLSPEDTIRKGDRIVAKTTDGQIMAKEMIRQTSSKTILRSLNDDHDDITLSQNDIEWIARIIWVSQ